jgi:hypothetical protein
MSDLINNENIGKPVIAILDTKSLFSQSATFYDKWSIFRFFMMNPEGPENLNVDLRKYRLKEDGTREYCDEMVSYTLGKEDPEVAQAINSLITLAIKKGVELKYFRH